VFAAPSIGALLITRPEASQTTGVGVVWGFAVFVVLAAAAIAGLLEKELAASDKRPPRSSSPCSGPKTESLERPKSKAVWPMRIVDQLVRR
jgi:hypothetical protein